MSLRTICEFIAEKHASVSREFDTIQDHLLEIYQLAIRLGVFVNFWKEFKFTTIVICKPGKPTGSYQVQKAN
jgi:hypothetical protein